MSVVISGASLSLGSAFNLHILLLPLALLFWFNGFFCCPQLCAYPLVIFFFLFFSCVSFVALLVHVASPFGVCFIFSLLVVFPVIYIFSFLNFLGWFFVYLSRSLVVCFGLVFVFMLDYCFNPF
ncbi:hypothetical protein RND81_14G153800 [Saponaria officinalis]|uniref:NADH dehydrogenase subunit 6 n=1 Tax=Saponaria officinalis TaxID=3572 RepID=A0AAW1GNG4_SAPOF